MAVFVVAGIGVDDIFIVVHAMDRQSKALPLNERLALALFEAGPAIFLTSITNLLAFIVSSFVDFPAVEYFVVICGIAIFSTFGLTITLFAAFLFLDEQRRVAAEMSSAAWTTTPTVRSSQQPRAARTVLLLLRMLMLQRGRRIR